MIDSQPVNEQKIEDAFSIISSVGFWEREIYRQMALLEEAVNNSNREDMNLINKRIQHLFRKIEEECRNAENFIKKYGKGAR